MNDRSVLHPRVLACIQVDPSIDVSTRKTPIPFLDPKGQFRTRPQCLGPILLECPGIGVGQSRTRPQYRGRIPLEYPVFYQSRKGAPFT